MIPIVLVLKFIGTYLAIGLALWLLRHWKRWFWQTPRLLLLFAAWPYFILHGRVFDDEEPDEDE